MAKGDHRDKRINANLLWVRRQKNNKYDDMVS